MHIVQFVTKLRIYKIEKEKDEEKDDDDKF